MFATDSPLTPLQIGLDRVLAVNVSSLDDRTLDAAVLEVAAAKARLEAAEARLVSEWDNRGLWAYHGAKTPAAWLAAKRRLPIEACRRAPRIARGLRALPAVAAALAAGRIEITHVQRVLSCDNSRTHDALVADQVMITRWAMELRWGTFCRRLQDWLDQHDPDGAEPDAPTNRRLHCSKTTGDAYRLDGWLDPVAGTIFTNELKRLEQQLFDEDWAAAKAELGREPLLHELGRTPEQRRADALVLMAERSATLPEDGRRGQPLFTVLVGQDSLRRILELTNGTQLRPGQIAPYLPPALIEHFIFDTPTHVVGVSKQRNFRGLVRRVVQAAHRQCGDETCQEPIDRCEVDHIHEWSKGGLTCQENGQLRCGFHNRARNNPGSTDRSDTKTNARTETGTDASPVSTGRAPPDEDAA